MTVLILSRDTIPTSIQEAFTTIKGSRVTIIDEVFSAEVGSLRSNESFDQNDVDSVHGTVNDEWAELLASDSARLGLGCSITKSDVLTRAAETELLADKHLSQAKLVFALDDICVPVMFHALVRYVVICGEASLNLLESSASTANAFRYALKMAPSVLATTARVREKLSHLGISSNSIDDCDLQDLAESLRNFEKSGPIAIDSLKQKKLEIVYEAKYGKIYNAKYHDAVCYQMMDAYLIDIVVDSIESLKCSGSIKLLDLGCGPGSMVPGLIKINNIVYTGVDISATMVDEARRLYPSLSFQVGDAEALSFHDNTFDVVLCSGMLHHFPDVGKVLREVQRVLKPGGILVCREPNEDNFAVRYPSYSYLHLQLKNIAHVIQGTQSIVEPDEHEFHTDFTHHGLVDALAKFFRVENIFTSQKISYFYDMLMDSVYESYLTDLEASLEGIPGLNIVAVAKKHSQLGASLAVKEKISILDYPSKGWEQKHLRALIAFYDEISSTHSVKKFNVNSLIPENFKNAFDIQRSLIVSSSGMATDLADIPGNWVGGDVLVYDRFRDKLDLDQIAAFDHVCIFWDPQASPSSIVKAISRCKDYGVIEVRVSSDVESSPIEPGVRSFLNGLSPLSSVKGEKELHLSSMESPEVIKRFFLSRNLYTQKNFISSLGALIERDSVEDNALNEWIVERAAETKEQFEVSLMTGEFHTWLDDGKKESATDA